MASPQTENGFTKIAHEILDELCKLNLNGADFRIIMKIWRMTYGFNRKDHDFSISFLQEGTGLSERATQRAISKLIDQRILVVTQAATKTTPRKLSFNKDYDKWIYEKDGDPEVEQGDLFGDNIVLKKSSATDLFDKFYSAYPRKAAKSAALKAWNTLKKEPAFDAERIIINTMNFAETCKLLKTEAKYIPHPSTYLNQKRYEDYEKVDPEGLAETDKPKRPKDPMIVARNREMALNRFVREGGDPEDFRYEDE